MVVTFGAPTASSFFSCLPAASPAAAAARSGCLPPAPTPPSSRPSPLTVSTLPLEVQFARPSSPHQRNFEINNGNAGPFRWHVPRNFVVAAACPIFRPSSLLYSTIRDSRHKYVLTVNNAN